MSTNVKNREKASPRTSRERSLFGFSLYGGRRMPFWRFALNITGAITISAGAAFVFLDFPTKAYQAARDQVASLAGQFGFEIRTVRLAGNSHVSDQMLLFALGARPGEAIFEYDVVAAKERVMALQWVKDVSIQRFWPDTLQVIVEERKPFALWQRGGRIWVIDAEGHTLEELSNESFAGLPLLVGHGANRRAEEMLALMESFPTIASQVQAYVRVADRRWNLRLRSGADVKLPEKDYLFALDMLAELEKKESILARDLEVVDLRINDRITVRLTENAFMQRDAAIKAGGNRSRTGGRT